MFVVKIAWRNILRHKRRSIFALLTIITGVVSIILFGGFVNANYSGLRESVIRSQYGHVQIHLAGYEENFRKNPNNFRMPPELSSLAVSVLENIPHVLIVSKRLEFTGLLGNEKNSRAAVIRGIEPDKESLINSALTFLDGSDLDNTEPTGAILGAGLAQGLNAKVGDNLTLLAATVNGVMNAVDIKVVGIFQSFAKEYDDTAMLMMLENAQTLLNSQSVDTVVALLDDTNSLPEVVTQLADKVSAQHLNLEWIEWFKLAIFYQKVVDLYDGFFLFINLVIYIVVLFGIANTMIVTVMERTAEIGTLRAMGMHKSGIIRQFLIEGLLLAFLGSLAGVIISLLLTWFINHLDIMMAAPPGSSKDYPLRLEYVPRIWLISVTAVSLIAFFATLLPSVQASRKTIIEALRHV